MIEFLEKLESALCEKCDVDHSDCIGENECFCTLDMARAYQKGRADAINEIHTDLMTEIAMLNATKMTDVDLYAFAVRIKEITDKLISK